MDGGAEHGGPSVGIVADFATAQPAGHGAVRGAVPRVRGVVAERHTRGAWYRDRRLVAFDGSTLDVADEVENRETFGLSGSGRGQAAFPQVRLTAMVEVGTRAAFAWCRGPLRDSDAEQAERLLVI